MWHFQYHSLKYRTYFVKNILTSGFANYIDSPPKLCRDLLNSADMQAKVSVDAATIVTRMSCQCPY